MSPRYPPLNPQTRSGAYSASKAAVLLLSRQLAAEWGPRGVRSNAVLPGMIRTALSAKFYEEPGFEARRAAVTASRRIGEPVDIAEPVMFLASDRSAYVNGAELLVDGGLGCMLMDMVPAPGLQRHRASDEIPVTSRNVNMPNDIQCDLVVVGSGAAGLTTAITARKRGLNVVVIEKEPVFGGTTAISGGVLWIPLNAHGRKQNPDDSLEAVRTFMMNETGNYLRRRRRRRLPREWPAHGRVPRARDGDEIHPDALSRLPSRCSRRRRCRPLDTGGALRHTRTRQGHGAAEAAAEDHHLHGHDVQLVERRPETFLPRDEIAGLIRLCRQTPRGSYLGTGALRPRNRGHERQRAWPPAWRSRRSICQFRSSPAAPPKPCCARATGSSA